MFDMCFMACGLLLSCVGCLVTARAQAVVRPASTSAHQFMGMHTLSPTRHWPTVPFGAMRPAGTTWGTIEPSRGVFDWHGLDTWVAQSMAHHVQFDYVFLNTPQWASQRPDEKCNRGPIGCAAPPTDDDWRQFVTVLVTRYKGRIADYEMWNEPNAIGFFTGSAADMAHMVSIAYPIIKSIDPNAVVVAPSPSSTGWPTPFDEWIDQFLKAGGGKYVDVMSWHAYAGRTNQPANPPEDLVSQITKIHSILEKHNLGGMPLWDTEGGWGKNSQLPDEQQQAAFLSRWLLIQYSYGIGRVYWYQWDNPNFGTLWTEGIGETIPAQTLTQIYSWLDGATVTSKCASTHGSLWTCGLSKNGQDYLVAWSTAQTDRLSEFNRASAYIDAGGNQHSITEHSVSLSNSPILLKLQ